MHNSSNTEIGELLASGGDKRIVLTDDGLNKYGCSPFPRLDVIGFGSCTSSSTSLHGFAAVAKAHRRLTEEQCGIETLLDETRAQLRTHLGLSEEIEIALAPSGTDAEMLATTMAATDKDRQLLNIIVGPSEVGSGTQNAAAGRYYNPLTPDGSEVVVGEPINLDLAKQVLVKAVDIRDARGVIRPVNDLEAEVTQLVTGALDVGLPVLLHVVAHSKTGITAPSLSFAQRLKHELDDDIAIVVDVAQGRLGRERMNELLAAGCQVIWTGSKFVGGPPFAGALFAPKSTVPQHFEIPSEFNQFFSLDELPESWRVNCSGFSEWKNTGAALRWAAAIEELKRFYDVSHEDRVQVMERFEDSVCRVLSEAEHIALQRCARAEEFCSTDTESVDPEMGSFGTVFSFCVEEESFGRLSREELIELHRELNGAGFHLGQPVKLCEEKWALRIALSMPLVVQLATDDELGKTLDSRFVWLENRIRELTANIAASLADKVSS